MARLFALDHNFPDPIVAVLSDLQADADLVRIDGSIHECQTRRTGNCYSHYTSIQLRGTVDHD